MPEVTLTQILDAREKRVGEQRKMLSEHNAPLISFTMNIAGPLKTSPLIERAFNEGLRLIGIAVDNKLLLDKKITYENTGCEALFCVSANASDLKIKATKIEEANNLGRLFDIDIIDINGKKLEREYTRTCIICGAPGRKCAAGRLHPVNELQAKTTDIISDYFRKSDADKIGRLAVESLIDEVETTPKPGLVDNRNNGSHTDMNKNTFLASANALFPYFRNCVDLGQHYTDKDSCKLFHALREEGIKAEKIMYEATNGINTHKGAIYSFGILCGAIGYLWKADSPIADINDILTLCSHISSTSVDSDFLKVKGCTAGEKAYLRYGLTGIRGEAASGFSSVKRIGLPSFNNALKQGLSYNDAGVYTLLHLISEVEDTNLYHRGGPSGAKLAKKLAKASAESRNIINKAAETDDLFISKNLSPGGCADLLAITYFIYKLQNLF